MKGQLLPINLFLWFAKFPVEILAAFFCFKRNVDGPLRIWIIYSITTSSLLMMVYFTDGNYPSDFWFVQIFENLIIMWTCLEFSRLLTSWVSSIAFSASVLLTFISGPPVHQMLNETQIVMSIAAGTLIASLALRKVRLATDGIAYAIFSIVGLQIFCGLMQNRLGLNQWTRTLWQVAWIVGMGILVNALRRFKSAER